MRLDLWHIRGDLIDHSHMSGRRLIVSDLIELAAMPGDGAAEHLSKIYDWQYSHIVSQARGLAGTGVAILTVAIIPLIQPDADNPTPWIYMWIILSAALILMVAGSVLFSFASRVHREYLIAQTLLSELVEIQPFIRRYRSTSK